MLGCKQQQHALPIKESGQHRCPPCPYSPQMTQQKLGQNTPEQRKKSFLYNIVLLGFYSIIFYLWIIIIHLYC